MGDGEEYSLVDAELDVPATETPARTRMFAAER